MEERERMMMGYLAPIVLFVYNRLEHTKRTVEALKKNDLASESELFIYSDGPKKKEESERIEHVREYIHQIEGFKKITIIERNENLGLAKSIVTGVTEIIENHEKIIVLEDDLITHKDFLKFMNEGLSKYKDDLKVYCLSGYSYVGEEMKNIGDYFLKICSSWSWATWKDRWEQYDELCEGWNELTVDKQMRKKFNYDNSYPYYSLLSKQMRDNTVNSWAIKWYWTVFKNDGLTLFPAKPLVINNGFDGTGEHCGIEKKKIRDFAEDNQGDTAKCNVCVEEKIQIRKKVAKAIRRQNSIIGNLQIIKDMI